MEDGDCGVSAVFSHFSAHLAEERRFLTCTNSAIFLFPGVREERGAEVSSEAAGAGLQGGAHHHAEGQWEALHDKMNP